MPADSDDEEDYHIGDEEDEEGEDADTPTKEEPKEDKVRLSLLGDSVWTKIEVSPEKPGEEKLPNLGEENEE